MLYITDGCRSILTLQLVNDYSQGAKHETDLPPEDRLRGPTRPRVVRSAGNRRSRPQLRRDRIEQAGPLNGDLAGDDKGTRVRPEASRREADATMVVWTCARDECTRLWRLARGEHR
jgi:hypothetical protein